MYQGWWRVQQRELERGAEMLERALHGWRATGAGNVGPYQRALIADAYSRAGRDVEACEWIDAAIEWVGNVDERCHEAEVHRLKGDILLRLQPARRTWRRSLIPRGPAHRAWSAGRGWELRTATSLARLRQSQGKRAEGRELLAPIFNWFTEGFDTTDLKEAKALLDELH